MTPTIPDLWKTKEKDAPRLYAMYLGHLVMNDRFDRVVAACRKIRDYAARGPGAKEALFTYDEEIDALCELRKYKAAWRQLRSREDVIYGRQFEISTREGPFANPYESEWHYAPLLYFLKRFDVGCSLLENALDVWFTGRELNSYENLLFRVCNDDEQPLHRCRVTLSHFYLQLGKNLAEWRHWNEFVDGFHPKLFQLARLSQTQLRADSGCLPAFFQKLLAIRDKRVPTRIGGGLSDLTDSPAKVKKRQETLRRQKAAFDTRIDAKRKQTDSKLRKLFPDLQHFSR